MTGVVQTNSGSARRRGRRQGVEIRPGSVKEARMKAGLSLGQVARHDISRTAIYFVESGKARPSQETLELIAMRTGQPIDFFLTGADSADRHPALRIAELERLLATGDNAGVVAAAESALAQSYDADTTARIKLHASMATLRLAQPIIGRRLAVEARIYFEKVGDLERVAEALGHEAQAAGLMEDPGSVQIAEGALATCRALKPVPKLLEARLLRVLGHQLLSRERWNEAITCYDEAIATGEVVQDLQQLSLLYSGMSYAHQELGQISEATRFAQKALTIHETLHDRLSQARSLNNLGWMLVNLGEFAAARTYLDRSLRIFDELHVELGKGNVLVSLADLEFGEGRLETAAATARRALELATRLGELSTASSAFMLLGRIAARRGKDGEVDQAFEQALELGVRIGGHRLSRIHEVYAEILEARGDLANANRHLKRALTVSRPASAIAEARTASA
jgi:tetratricopeptide (TPR) repeat protein